MQLLLLAQNCKIFKAFAGFVRVSDTCRCLHLHFSIRTWNASRSMSYFFSELRELYMQ